jgi:hypothetical protein
MLCYTILFYTGYHNASISASVLACGTAAAGTVYEGDWVHGVREGRGKLSFKDGSYYRGEMQKNQMWGHGIYVGADNSQYDGEWRANVRQGTGTALYSDGRYCTLLWCTVLCCAVLCLSVQEYVQFYLFLFQLPYLDKSSTLLWCCVAVFCYNKLCSAYTTESFGAT